MTVSRTRMAALPQPSQGEVFRGRLDDAVDNLADLAKGTAVDYENEGELNALISSLGSIRDRADTIQNAAIGVRNALEENL